VYAAWDDHLKRTVAIKRMKTAGIDDSVLANPWKEAIRLAAIHHSNIVTVFDMGQDEGVPYIVMEFVQGETLEERVARRVFSLVEFGELARQTLDGLIAAHHVGLIHRDIKPSNLMLTTHPSGFFQVKILDFGTAKFLEAPSAQTMNLDGTIMGSVCWISPEQVNREPVDVRSDVYSLGCVYYFALSGQRPFDGSTTLEILTAHLAHTLVPLETLRPDLPPTLCQWVMAMINLRPEHRYQTAMQALAALQGILGYTLPIALPPVTNGTVSKTAQPAVPSPGAVLADPSQRSKPVPLPLIETRTQPLTSGTKPPSRLFPFSLPFPFQWDFRRMRLGLIPGLTIAVAVLAVLVIWLSVDRANPAPAPRSSWKAARIAHRAAQQLADALADSSASTSGTGALPASETPPAEATPAPTAQVQPIAAATASPTVPSTSPAQTVAVASPTPSPVPAPASPTPAAATPPPPVVAEIAPVPAQVVFRVHGSNTIGTKLLPALMEEFLKTENASKIVRKSGKSAEDLNIEMTLPGQARPCAVEIAAHGSKTAFEDLLAGRCDLGMASRPVKDEEAVSIAIAGLGDLHRPTCEHVLGLDGITIVVNKDNPVPSLTREQVAKIFSGELADWSQVGGQAGPIRPYSPHLKSGTFDVFKALVLDRANLSATARLFEDNSELSDAVAADPAAIGFVGLPFVRDSKAVAIADVGMSPLMANRLTIGTEDYILSRRLYLYSAARPKNPWVCKFVDFALSDAGQEIVQRLGFVRQTPEVQTVALPPEAPRTFVETVKGAKRLSLNFRFKPRSTQLDNKALRDLDRIVGLLTLPQYRGKQLLLIGFSDNAGNPRVNQHLSIERAQVMARELATRGIQPAMVTGFGSILPVTGNDTAEGRDKNRRVEVWIR